MLGVAFSAIVVLLQRNILNWMNIPQESWEMARGYLVICGAGLVFTAGYNMVSAVLRGMGDSKSPFLFVAIASVTNLVLDLLFTGLWGWGVAGAAWATIIGQAVSFLFSLWYLYRRKEAFGFDFKFQSFIPQKKYVGMILNLGTPIAIQAACINLSMLFVNAMVNSVGVVDKLPNGIFIHYVKVVLADPTLTAEAAVFGVSALVQLLFCKNVKCPSSAHAVKRDLIFGTFRRVNISV
jgi:Na+-driven multidrug efflux pump